MEDKINAQLELARKIRAVSEERVAEMILSHHLLPDLTGNLAGFGKQQFRCTKCNTKYRRPPLSGRCTNCGNGLILTVPRGGIEKYLGVARRLKGLASEYTKSRLEAFEEALQQTFPKRQMSLADFLS
jgi:DNA polymerase II large subunit